MNYSAFSENNPYLESIKVAIKRLKEYSGSSRSRLIITVVQAIAVFSFVTTSFLMFVFSAKAYFDNSADAPFIVVLFFAALFLTCILLCAKAFNDTGKNIAIMKRFAADNNLQFHPWLRVHPGQGIAFSPASQRFARNGVTGKVGNHTFWLYEYRFSSGTPRTPYPNIFTVLNIELDKNYQQTMLINKNGRLKMIWPRGNMKKVDTMWYGIDNLHLYAENGQLDASVSKLLPAKKLQSLLQISPKAEIQIHDKTLSIFLPGKAVPDAETAKKLLDFAKDL